MCIRDSHKDTHSFYSEDASGSTSQAANVIEALETGSHLLLIDEDTSATNFMIRDELMQRVVNRNQEPNTPFIERVQWLSDTPVFYTHLDVYKRQRWSIPAADTP